MVKKLTSRKFWVAVASGVFVVISEGLGADIPTETYWSVVGLAMAYIFGEAYVDAKKQ